MNELNLNNATLGTYRKWCKRLNLIEKEYLTPLDDLISKRNSLVHDHGYLKRLEKGVDEKERKGVKEIVKEACDFIQNN